MIKDELGKNASQSTLKTKWQKHPVPLFFFLHFYKYNVNEWFINSALYLCNMKRYHTAHKKACLMLNLLVNVKRLLHVFNNGKVGGQNYKKIFKIAIAACWTE